MLLHEIIIIRKRDSLVTRAVVLSFYLNVLLVFDIQYSLWKLTMDIFVHNVNFETNEMYQRHLDLGYEHSNFENSSMDMIDNFQSLTRC